MNKLRIIYMGTPDFAVAPLEELLNANCNIVGVITNPDKPAGRGQKIKESAVKIFAKEKGLNILQPEKFRDPNFIEELKNLKADIQIVVAFKMLPEIVWNMPKYGTVNIHASLLPHYRGAAPINWALINGDKQTGVSTFLLKHEIDTGNIIYQEKINIDDSDNVEDIHDKLMDLGAKLIVKTVQSISEGNYPQVNQNSLVEDNEEIKIAPKIFKDDCKINWNKSLTDIHNIIRGLSPYPAAWTQLNPISGEGKSLSLKIFKTEKIIEQHNFTVGSIHTDKKKYLKIATKEGFINITNLQLAGKKRMECQDFLRGFQQIENYFLA